ncbi:unnamed protein product [Citrullus colocynthis]|uniref:EF-hand domain-containing protein n=1 Tax=Citrullus colocynthis TaxID=252529 RepID=A0ABP0XWP4_9ROSI
MSVSQFQALAENEVNELIKKYDRNGDGVLNKEELQSFFNVRDLEKKLQDKAHNSSTKVMNRKQSNVTLSREQIKEIFKYHDSDKDGFLNIQELTRAFGSLGSMIPFYKARYGMIYADADKDGLISETELDKLIDYANKIIKKK